MTAEEPKISDGARVPIGKTAELLGIHRSTLLEHTKLGLIRCKFCRTNKRKRYDGIEIKRYWRATS